MLSLNSTNFWQSIKKDRFLLLILLFGLLLRGLNPTFGSPSLYVSNDEAIAHLAAWNMLAEKTPVSIANYTPLGAYIQIPFLVASFLLMKILGIVSNAGSFELFVLTHEGYFLFVPRLISAFFGTLTILVIYKMTFSLFKNRQTAIISAFLTAVSFNLVHISHFGRPWAAALFFFVAAIYLLIKKRIALSYISIGIAYGFHQVGLLAIPLLLWLTTRTFTAKNLINVCIFLIMLLIFSSLTLRTGLIDSIRSDQSFLKVGKLAADIFVDNPNLVDSAIRSVKDNLILFFSINFLVTDGIISIFAILGVFKSFKEPIQKKLIYYIFGYFLFASLFFHPLPRYLLPIFLISTPFAANVLKNTFQKSNFFLALLLFAASFNSLWWNYIYLKTPTFIEAHDWIKQNISANDPIAYIGARYQTFSPSKEAIIKLQKIDQNVFKRLGVIIPEGKVDNVRNIIYLSKFPGKSKTDQLKTAQQESRIDHVVDYYLDPKDSIYNLQPGMFDVIASFNPTISGDRVVVPEPLFDASWNFATNDFKPKASMYSLSRIGPYVDVLRINNLN